VRDSRDRGGGTRRQQTRNDCWVGTDRGVDRVTPIFVARTGDVRGCPDVSVSRFRPTTVRKIKGTSLYSRTIVTAPRGRGRADSFEIFFSTNWVRGASPPTGRGEYKPIVSYATDAGSNPASDLDAPTRTRCTSRTARPPLKSGGLGWRAVAAGRVEIETAVLTATPPSLLRARVAII